MTDKNRIPHIGNLQFVVVSLLLSLATAGVALAQNPWPLIYQPLVPDTVIPGAAAFTLTVNGTGFVSGAVVDWNGSPLATTFVSGSRLTASVPASDVATAGTASVTVTNPEGWSSNPVFFPVSLPVYLSFSASPFPAGSGPRSLATADFRGDGILDLIVPDTGSGDVSVLLGNGDGTFQAPVSYPVGHGSSSQFFQVAVADLNGDGKLDFVVCDNDDNYVSVFLGNGDGTFQPGVTYEVGTNPTSVAVADVNGDGKPDLVVTNQNCTNGGSPCGDATVSILLGKGDGSFQPQSDYAAGQGANAVAVGDFNGDGNLDLAVVNGNAGGPSALLILLGDGDGRFHTSASYPLNTNGASVATADFNGDGKLDIAVVDNIGLVSILLGNGDGTFQARTDYPVGSFPFGSIAIGDFNEDGHLDIAVANSGSKAGRPCAKFKAPCLSPIYTASVLLGNGDGTFQPQIPVNTGSFPQGVVAGDFNRDGRLDLAVVNLDDNTVSILLQDGSVSLSPTSLDFGLQLVGKDATKEVTLTNAGTATLTITGIAITGTDASDFIQSNTCGSSLDAGKSCAISVTFAPSRLGTLGASITVSDSDPSSPQTVPLSGTGVLSGPNATLSDAVLDFRARLLNTTSAAKTVTLSDYGTEALSVTSFKLTGADSGDFAQTNTCGSSVAAGASCTISVTFTPTGVGTRSGTLTVTDNNNGTANSTQSVSLTGTGGVGPVISLSAPPSFPSEPVGTTSPPQTVTVTNTGIANLTFSAIGITGPFAIATSGTTCPTRRPVAASAFCNVAITFTPTAGGSASGTLSFTDNAGGSPQSLALTAMGQDFTLAVASGTPSTFTVSPGGTATYTISASGIGGFNQAVDLSCSGAPSGASCQLSQTSVTPTSSGATVTVTVTTMVPSVTAPHSRHLPPTRPHMPWPGNLVALALLLAGVAWTVRDWGQPGTSRVRTGFVTLAMGMLLALAMAACGGGGSSPPSNPGTPPGTYIITVTGGFGSGSSALSRSVTITLTVS